MHPGIVRHILSPLIERVLGRATFARLAELEANQWWSASQLRDLQATKLRRLLKRAGSRCPYYAERLAVDRDDDDGDPFASLANLPLLDKATIRTHREDMIDRHVPGGPIPSNTGGSTGDPLTFYTDRSRIAADKAARALTHAWFGARPGDREVYLWGSPVELGAQDRLKALRDRLTNEMLLSAFDLSATSMPRYLRRMHAFDPVSVFGYPSSLTTLAECCAGSGLTYTGPSLRAVFATGEVLDDVQRDTLRRFFGADVWDGYGSRDGGFIAHECPAGRRHVFAQHLIVEIVDETGTPCRYGQLGEIVVTHLESQAMPMLRYRTGDFGRMSDQPCPCGRGMEVLEEVTGRTTDHLVSADGTLLHGLSAIYVLREMPVVRRFQVHQRRDRSLRVQVVPDGVFTDEDSAAIRAGLQRRLGTATPVEVSAVAAIKSHASGKFRQIISDAVDMGPSRSPEATGMKAVE